MGGPPVTADEREYMTASERPLAEVLRAHASNLMTVPGVVGVAEGVCNGQPCIKVFVARKTPDVLKAIPASVEGYPVVVEETGEFRPFAPRP